MDSFRESNSFLPGSPLRLRRSHTTNPKSSTLFRSDTSDQTEPHPSSATGAAAAAPTGKRRGHNEHSLHRHHRSIGHHHHHHHHHHKSHAKETIQSAIALHPPTSFGDLLRQAASRNGTSANQSSRGSSEKGSQRGSVVNANGAANGPGNAGDGPEKEGKGAKEDKVVTMDDVQLARQKAKQSDE
jgi:hypothetical protein